jgi:transketolase
MDQWMKRELPEGWEADLPAFPADPKGAATRAASGNVLNALAKRIKNLVGGSADLAPSNQTLIKGEVDFQAEQFGSRNFRFGVREHGMGAILNGMALHGGLIPYGGTFLIFSDYMRPAIRLAALMQLQVIYVFTHDSIGLGEDGPTHQPVEQLAALRAIPNLTVLRPCDASETAEAWRFALSHQNGPVALVLTRQGVPVLDRSVFAPAAGLQQGAYALAEPAEGKPDLLLIASGSEVHLAIEASKKLGQKGISSRVVSMPSWELLDQQSDAYRRDLFPPEIKVRIAIEAGRTQGWWRYVGEKGDVVGIDHFGASAPYKILYEMFGITADRVVEKALRLLGK